MWWVVVGGGGIKTAACPSKSSMKTRAFEGEKGRKVTVGKENQETRTVLYMAVWIWIREIAECCKCS